jgi:hypothetical protein
MEDVEVVSETVCCPEEIVVEVSVPRFPTDAFGLNARVVFDASAHSIPPIICDINVGFY